MTRAAHPPASWPALLVAMDAGVPDITNLRHDRIVHGDGSPYLDRYHLVETAAVQARFHHWRSSDDQHAPHDHPWPNLTMVLAGELLEHTTTGTTTLTPGTVRTRTARDAHTIELLGDGAWSLFVTGPIERQWGFHTAAGWVLWTRWPHAGRYE